MTILSIDPGPSLSALVIWNGSAILEAAKEENDKLRLRLMWEARKTDTVVVCEKVASYGLAVGKEVFMTCFWTGRFWEVVSRLDEPFHLVERREVKLHLCGQARAKDSNIRQALIDRFGGKGTKANPGLTYGLKADTWQAFALAVTCSDRPNLLTSVPPMSQSSVS